MSAGEWDIEEEREEAEERDKMSAEEIIAHVEAQLAVETLHRCGWVTCSEVGTDRGFCPEHRRVVGRMATVARWVLGVGAGVGVLIAMIWFDVP